MKIQEQKLGSLCIVSLAGRVDGIVAPELETRIARITERGDVRVLLDLHAMSYISSAGLRAVLAGARQCQQGGGKLAICALQPACRRVFEISGFLEIIDCHDSRDAALEAES